MTQTVRISQLGEYISRHFVDVFGSMLGLGAVLSQKTQAQPFSMRVSGAAGFAGESLAGAIYIHLSEPFARRAAMAMLGRSEDDLISPAEVNDAVGEMANLLAGGLKSWLCESGITCAMSASAIIRGTSFVIEPNSDVERERLIFECGEELVTVEIHLKVV